MVVVRAVFESAQLGGRVAKPYPYFLFGPGLLPTCISTSKFLPLRLIVTLILSPGGTSDICLSN